MTFPTIESITPTTNAAETNHVIDYPATVNAGDLLICSFGCDDNETVTFPGEGNVCKISDGLFPVWALRYWLTCCVPFPRIKDLYTPPVGCGFSLEAVTDG